MSTFDQLVNETRQALSGLGLVQPRASFLVEPVQSTGETTFYVTDASGFSQGIAEIGTELVFIESVDYDANTLAISPDGRGYYDTTAATHVAGTRIEMAPAWPKTRIVSALNDAIVGTFPALFGVDTTSFTFNPAVNTYDLPASAESVLQVTTDTLGPSGEQVRINRYSVDTTANTITLLEAGWPGRTVTVTYAKRPAEIASGDDFTDSGLAESAKLAVRYAACSQLLAYLDASRLVTDTAVAGEFDASKTAVGSAERASLRLYQRYEIELAKEQKRLRTAYPQQIRVRTR